MITDAICIQFRIADCEGPVILVQYQEGKEEGHNVKETKFLVMLESPRQGIKMEFSTWP